MKRLFSLFLFVVMTINVSVSLVEQLQGRNMCELTEMSADDADEKSKTEKEKESYIFLYHSTARLDAFLLKNLKKSLIVYNDRLRSQLHAAVPYLPPEV